MKLKLTAKDIGDIIEKCKDADVSQLIIGDLKITTERY